MGFVTAKTSFIFVVKRKTTPPCCQLLSHGTGRYGRELVSNRTILHHLFRELPHTSSARVFRHVATRSQRSADLFEWSCLSIVQLS